VKRLGALLPVELRHANHTASTNAGILRLKSVTEPYNSNRMSSVAQIEQIAERVERLLVRYEELQRTNALLSQQLEMLTQERDSLRSRLSAARARVDALLERLPDIRNVA
jgi:chromosome segregation ATPase